MLESAAHADMLAVAPPGHDSLLALMHAVLAGDAMAKDHDHTDPPAWHPPPPPLPPPQTHTGASWLPELSVAKSGERFAFYLYVNPFLRGCEPHRHTLNLKTET